MGNRDWQAAGQIIADLTEEKRLAGLSYDKAFSEVLDDPKNAGIVEVYNDREGSTPVERLRRIFDEWDRQSNARKRAGRGDIDKTPHSRPDGVRVAGKDPRGERLTQRGPGLSLSLTPKQAADELHRQVIAHIGTETHGKGYTAAFDYVASLPENATIVRAYGRKTQAEQLCGRIV